MRDIDALTKRLRKRGYVLIRRTKHGYLFRTPRGFSQLVPINPSNDRALKNLDGEIRKKERR